MSIRTIIEINHDYIHDLREEPEHLQRLLDLLSGGQWQEIRDGRIPGVRYIGDRHHSESRTFKVD